MKLYGGIDLGGTKIQAAVVGDGESVLGSARRPTPKDSGVPGVVEAMAQTLRDAARAGGVDPAELSGVGVGSPGTVDEAAGTVESAVNVLPQWREAFPLAAQLSAALGVPVTVGNDVRVATDAEFHLGAGRPYASVLGVFWGTGVGGGLVLEERTWLGRGAAGEIGHMVIRRGGARCSCGRRGCMEAYAGRLSMELRARAMVDRGLHTDLFRIMEQRGRTQLSSGVWAHALQHGDRLAERLVERAVRALGAGIASAVNLLDVEAVVIGGGMGVRLGADYVGRISQAMQPHLFVSERPPDVLVAGLGDLGGAIGAALLSESDQAAANTA
jgi:glucokinase